MTISAAGRFRSRITLLGASVAAMIVILGGCGVTSSTDRTASLPTIAPPSTTPTTTLTTSPAAEGNAESALTNLAVKGSAPWTPYERTLFLPNELNKLDSDGNGCDQRNDVLARELTEVTIATDECVVRSGTLADPYTGRTIQFERGYDGNAADVEIDHVVALGDAWTTGAQQLTPERRETLATDLRNLQATDRLINQAKGASDAAHWLPPNESYQCTYVARQIAIKAAFGLWVTQPEHDKMVAVLATCPGQQLPTANP